ncbi:MAG: EAL domain-containing protein [Sulfuricurvum sp.]
MSIFKIKLYLPLFISFTLLFISLFISFNSIHETNKMISYIQTKQLKLVKITTELNQHAQSNQINIFKAILTNDAGSINNVLNSYTEINLTLQTLKGFISENSIDIPSMDEKLTLIQKRIISYQLVQQSLIEALKTKNQDDTYDAIIGFNATNTHLSKDIEELITLVNDDLNRNIDKLKNSSENSKKDIVYSFGLALALIVFSFYKFTMLRNQAISELKRAELAEEEQKKLQHQLLKYNDDLEEQIAMKSRELHQKVYSHFLSGLPNRNQLLEDIQQNEFKHLAILNIDKFQKFNDLYGEEIGNVALVMCSRFLQDRFNPNEDLFLYHLGGDEFVVSMKNSSDLYNARFVKKISDILEVFSHHVFVYDDKKFTFNITAGIAFDAKDKILAYADMALKDAKKRNKRFSLFSEHEELERVYQEDIECHKNLLYAFENNNILSFFQPIVPIQNTQKPIKYESLVRLKKMDGKIIPPFNFIRIAKANRIYHKLTLSVLHNTLAVIERYSIPCSLNLSMEDIEDEQTLDILYKRLSQFEQRELLTIELLETEEFKEYTKVYDFCTKLRSYGIKIALDDFGSGYSNFSHVINLPVDYIKIDASLISNIDRNYNSKMMVETIVSLAKKMHIETIAEFVSSKEILETIRDLGVDYAQGYYTGKPEPIEFYQEISAIS